MKWDLHIHTSRYSPDSVLNPFALVRRAEEIGLDGIVITEHDWLWSEDELDELRAAAHGLVILAGVEVSTVDGHFLAYGIEDTRRTPRGIGVKELADEVHQQGGAIIGAHPFRWGQPFLDILAETGAALDGTELMSSNMNDSERANARDLWENKRWTGLGSSDAHDEMTLGCCFTEFEEEINDSAALVTALRGRTARAMERE